MRASIATVLSASLCAASLCRGAEANAAGEVREIPLSEVWGYKTPGSRKLLDLDNVENTMSLPRSRRFRESYFWQVRSALGGVKFLPDGAGAVFVVEGTGKQAFKNARDVMVGDKSHNDKFPPDSSLSLVFFAHEDGAIYVHLSSISVTDSKIRLTYQPVYHESYDTTCHFALIPIGSLPEGQVSVEVIRNPTVDADGEPGYTPNTLDLRVSHSTSFTIIAERN